MRYLTVMADYHGTGIKDDFEGPVTPTSLGLPEELIARIAKWVDDYQTIILVPAPERPSEHKKIEQLDQVGLALARDLKQHFGDGAKVQYYSEGQLKRILP